jgi:arsenate reductase-like glutaredoxin family protein
METVALPVQLIPVVHEYISGVSVDDLALKHGMEVTQITDFLNRKEVKTFINTRMKNYRLLNLQKRIDLLTDAVDEKVAFAKENDLPMSNKDIVDILKLLREEAKDLSSELKENDVDDAKNTYINIINQLKS